MKNGSEKKTGAMSGSSSGLSAAEGRNPNSHPNVNDAPTGPYSHLMGKTDDGGMAGGTSVSGKNGAKFNFK